MNWRTYECDFCPRLAESCTQVVVATPCRQGGLLVIGEAPGGEEDANGIGFVGDAGRTLRKYLHDFGMQWPDYGVANICRCRPPCNSKGKQLHPTAVEKAQCLPYLRSLITDVKPKVILAVGVGTAANVLCGPGNLTALLDRGRNSGWRVNPLRAHKDLRNSLEHVSHMVPMPHTSGANTTPGHPEIARKQVGIAVELLNHNE